MHAANTDLATTTGGGGEGVKRQALRSSEHRFVHCTQYIVHGGGSLRRDCKSWLQRSFLFVAAPGPAQSEPPRKRKGMALRRGGLLLHCQWLGAFMEGHDVKPANKKPHEED
jgi:hypothetical protein